MIVACLGDSITAGSPLWDPDLGTRARIDTPDERSQWEWWAMRRDPSLDLRNHGVYGERTDQIAARLDRVLDGVAALVVQGGINDIAQRRDVDDAARNLAAMVDRGLASGVRVALADVLPWPNGDERGAEEIVRLNTAIHAIGAERGLAILPFHDTLSDPGRPHRMRDGLTDDGDHPSVEGHRLLGEVAFASFYPSTSL